MLSCQLAGGIGFSEQQRPKSGVDAFNIVASLVMVVTDKTNDIAVLRTLGMKSAGVVRVFFVQGAVIGWAGVFVGVLLGVDLATDVDLGTSAPGLPFLGARPESRDSLADCDALVKQYKLDEPPVITREFPIEAAMQALAKEAK